MKGQDNLLKIKLGCSRRPKKKRKNRCVVLLPVTRTWRNIWWHRVLKRLTKAKIVKDEFEKGCWWTSSKGTAQQTGWEGDSWPLSLRWRSPHNWSHTPALTAERQETSQKTPEKLSVLGGEGTGGQRRGLHPCLYCKPPRVSEKSV